MPAAPPGVLFIATIPDPANPDQILIVFQMNYNATNSNLTGATVTNNANRQLEVDVFQDGVKVRSMAVPKGTTTLTKNQLNASGFTTAADCDGFTFNLA